VCSSQLYFRFLQLTFHKALTGFPSRTTTGELSLSITSIPTLLAPRLHKVPEEVSDEQTLARFPQLELAMQRKKRDLLRLRHSIESRMHDFFNAQGFVKVSTPVLAASTGGAVAKPFVTHARRLHEHPLNLRISPELDLKKLIAAGMDRVYEIGPVFRNEGKLCSPFDCSAPNVARN
jgi:lysyl-tRNA synthetase, class II